MNSPDLPELPDGFPSDMPVFPPIPEFTDTYSDDLCYINDAQKVLRQTFGKSPIHDASACRIYIMLMVSSIEVQIRQMQEEIQKHNKKKPNKDLEVYISSDQQIDHDRRSRALKRFILKHAGPMQNDFLDDFFAIKKLRNIMIHGNWRKSNRKLMENCGFPADTRQLREEHLIRAEEVYKHMLFVLVCCQTWGRKMGWS